MGSLASDTWHLQLDGEIDLDQQVGIYDIDPDAVSADDVADLHARGVHVICYLNAGAYETWRSDASAFPPQVLGNVMDGWPDERWLDVRALDALLPIMQARIDGCAEKGFDAIDPGNVNSYANDSGFDLTESDLATYIAMLADLAHQRDMSIGLKNAIELIDDPIAGQIDFAINEQCMQYGECAAYQPLVNAGKAVLNIEYEGSVEQICSQTIAGIATVVADLDLDGPLIAC